jgi:hypothetical protein
MYDSGFGAGFSVFFLLISIGWLILVVTFVVAVWRMMKAHESIAESMYEISEDMKMRGGAATLDSLRASQDAPRQSEPGAAS